VRRAAAAAACGVALLAAVWTAGIAVAAPGDVVWRDLALRAPGGDDAYTALTVGPAGQVCAAGATASSPGEPSDVLVRAYGAGGSVLWRRVWTWPGRSDDGADAGDAAASAVVTGGGDVYVAGRRPPAPGRAPRSW